MKKVILFIFLICLFGCTNSESIEYKTISSEEAYDIMQKRDDIYIIDVRSENEFSTSHIEGAVNVPLEKIETTFKEMVTDNMDATILVYCQSGGRSKQASEILSNMGYTDINDFGGLSNWDYEIVK